MASVQEVATFQGSRLEGVDSILIPNRTRRTAELGFQDTKPLHGRQQHSGSNRCPQSKMGHRQFWWTDGALTEDVVVHRHLTNQCDSSSLATIFFSTRLPVYGERERHTLLCQREREIATHIASYMYIHACSYTILFLVAVRHCVVATGAGREWCNPWLLVMHLLLKSKLWAGNFLPMSKKWLSPVISTGNCGFSAAKQVAPPPVDSCCMLCLPWPSYSMLDFLPASSHHLTSVSTYTIEPPNFRIHDFSFLMWDSKLRTSARA